MFWNRMSFGQKENLLPEDDSLLAWCRHCGQKNRVPASACEDKKVVRCGKCRQPLTMGIDCLVICDVSPSMVEPAGETTRIAKLKHYLGKTIEGFDGQGTF